MKKLFLVCLMMVTIAQGLSAGNPPDEGMWLPIFVEQLNHEEMRKLGLRLTADEIYSINHSSMKDAIVNLGGFCTAEVVSPEGLMLTNHHCGYDAIQTHSSIDHDYLTDGFWAMTRDEELPNEGLTATFFIRMEDVTAKVLEGVTEDMTEADRQQAISAAMKKLEDEAAEDGKYDVQVVDFFEGNEYYLFVYQTYMDVRLVGAPPSAIGKFGGDTDNWMWPRHTGDFSMFRVYTGPDGSPAPYAKENIPFKAPYHLPVSVKGYKENDFAMIWGYPGQTDRYRTSYGIELTLKDQNPAIIHAGNIMLPLLKQQMDADKTVDIQYASKYANLANFWKNKIGESRGLNRLRVQDEKKALEDQFEQWINADPARKQKYGNVLSDLKEGYGFLKEKQIQKAIWYYQMPLFVSSAMIFPLQNMGLEGVLANKNVTQEDLAAFYARSEEHFKDYDPATEQKIYAEALKMLFENIPADLMPDIFTRIITPKYKNDFQAFAQEAFATSIFSTKTNYETFLAKPVLKKLQKDLMQQVTISIYQGLMGMNGMSAEVGPKIDRAKRLFIAGLREMSPGKVFYPDANSTMRLTYGQVLDYFPADAVHYEYYTTLEGVMEKEDPSNEEFIVPEKLKELYQKKDFGIYAEKGKMYVCFLTNTDITGGNSGSPVINGNGELIGIAFDGNWEAMSGDIAFEPALQRTINVDIRYVLFIIDKYAGAKHLVREMTLKG
ncbi:MAG TPA: S46 family peptidase [Bacteroidales bacterium]|nr:S46 family peptidase [Bacteroidales bacterium]HNS47277.1 S46 family peptidase [Bacteroidales bacterium]